MGFQPDANQRLREGVQRYESHLEDLERAARHGRQSGTSMRWLWLAVTVVVVKALLVVLFQLSAPAEVPLPNLPRQ